MTWEYRRATQLGVDMYDAAATDVPDAAMRDGAADAGIGWSEQHIQEGMRAAEFFEQHQRNVQAEEAESQLIAMLVGLVIGIVVVLVIKLRRSK